MSPSSDFLPFVRRIFVAGFEEGAGVGFNSEPVTAEEAFADWFAAEWRTLEREAPALPEPLAATPKDVSSGAALQDVER